MAIDPSLLTCYQHALILFQYPSTTLPPHDHPLLHSLITKSEYAAILRQFSHAFSYSSTSKQLVISFAEGVSELDRLICGIAALQAFVQTNWTGPQVELDPFDLLTGDSNGSSKSEDDKEKENKDERDAFDARAVEELAMQGEPAYHLIKKPGFLWLARRILGTGSDEDDNHHNHSNGPVLKHSSSDGGGLNSLPVWQLRLCLVNLRLLDTPVAVSGSLLSAVEAYISSLSSSSSSSSSSPSESTRMDLRTSLTLLLGLLHAQFVHLSPSANKLSSETFLTAARAAGLSYELTGRMGKRTKWQIDEKSQLVVLARSSGREDGWTPREAMSLKPDDGGQDGVAEYGEKGRSDQVITNGQIDPSQPKDLLLNDDTLLEKTHFTSTYTSTTNTLPAARSEDDDNASSLTSIDPNHQPVLHPLDECILLALSLGITNTSPTHGLTTTQISAFVSRVLGDGSQNWSVHSMALLLRSRLEANRSRTVERGLLQMQSLVDQLKLESVSTRPVAGTENAASLDLDLDLDLEKGATPLERLGYFYCLNLPSTWELERELATRYLGLGVVRSAMEIFTRLEMWEDVAKCYNSLGEPEKAIEVVKDLLEGKLLESESTMASRKSSSSVTVGGSAYTLNKAQQAKLWCLLGDLERDPAHYETAWAVSGHTSARAVRSLGQHLYLAHEYPRAQPYLEKALAINPLFGKVWFVLGCCAMRAQDWKTAERAFRRCTALDEDDGESWNNLATVLLQQVGPASASALPMESRETEEERDEQLSRKRTAFTCLGQAIKHAYDSWRIWTNYLFIAVDVGELMEACRAMTRLVELRADKDGEGAVDLDVLDRLVDVVVRETTQVKHADGQVSSDALASQRGLAGRVRTLFESAILPRLTASSHIYTSYARLLFALGDLSGSLQARLKAYRVDVVQNEGAGTDRAEFVKAGERVLETVDVLRNLGPREGKDGELVMKDWKSQARSVMRAFLGRTKESFGEEEAWQRIDGELKDLKNA